LAGRIPGWLRTGLPDLDALAPIRRSVTALGLNTICFEARCPNKKECFEYRSVSFLLMGRNCTRSCKFCNVSSAPPEPLDPREPEKLRRACADLGMEYVVLTSVTRDDLEDGGAGHFARCVRAVKDIPDAPVVEALVPDFGGSRESVETVAASGADVFSHNIETVERLFPEIRPGADYRLSLSILGMVSERFPRLVVKSGLMLGLGETIEEVKQTLGDLRGAGCAIVSMGQYMQPSRRHHIVERYCDPGEFEELGRHAQGLGLVAVAGPRVRSSYLARGAYLEATLRRQKCA
jgi:lipoic acid synthetase